jgi:putative restriction endonuclease
VNFWQPSGGRAFQAILPGEPFFFRLKRPYYKIAGFGYFARGTQSVPDWLAWESFGERNGAPSFDAMRRRIRRYLHREPLGGIGGEYRIGCLMISDPVFFEPDAWVEGPTDWSQNIVSGKTYDLAVGEGRRIWHACQERVRARLPYAAEERARYGEPVLVSPRLGQGTFRIAVTNSYGNACAVTNEHSLPVLDVAHIIPYAQGGSHETSNGLLLRTDIHRLFDMGYVTVTPDLHFEVSHLLKDQYENGRIYYADHGRKHHRAIQP